ncbi:MAG TPA: VWA domain-containing protein, partial [Vicinamibacteria bacterium]
MNTKLIPLLAGFILVPYALGAQAPATPPTPRPSPSPSPEAGTPSFPAQVELVTVDLVVTDKKGVPIPDLKATDFAVSEDGDPQSIASFEAVQLPATPSGTPKAPPKVSTNTEPESRTGRTFVILFDTIHLAPPQAQRAKIAVAEFLKNGVREGDRVTLIGTGGEVWWSTRMEAGRDALMAMLKRLDGRYIPDMAPDRMSDWEAMRIHVYHDTQVEQRVSRRFEQYGASTRGGTSASDTSSTAMMGGDPMVQGKASEVYFQSVSRNRITLQILERTLTSLASTKGRKSLILVSEGFIYDPNLDEFKKTVQASRRSNVAIYFLDTRGLTGMPDYFTAQFGPPIDTQDIGAVFMETLEASEGAESIAADTGGFSVKNTNDLGKGIQRIADESRTYYLLGYNSSHTQRDGRFRKIKVELAGRKGLQLRYRKGYFAPLEGGKSALDKRVGPGDPDIQAALDSPYAQEEVPLRMTAYVFDETILGKASVMIATDVDVSGFKFEEKEARFLDTLEFLLVVAHRETGEFFRYDQQVQMKLLPATRERFGKSWFPVVRDFELAPGGYQAKIVVRDKNSGRIGTVVHEFEVPDISQFRVSTPILSDALQPSPEGEKSVPRPVLSLRRAFPAGSTLYAEFDVYGAAKDKASGMPKVSAGYIIRRLDGPVQAVVSPTPIQPTSIGKLSRLVGSRLVAAEPGDYEFVLTVRDEIAGKTLELREPFTVTPAAPPPTGD